MVDHDRLEIIFKLVRSTTNNKSYSVIRSTNWHRVVSWQIRSETFLALQYSINSTNILAKRIVLLRV